MSLGGPTVFDAGTFLQGGHLTPTVVAARRPAMMAFTRYPRIGPSQPAAAWATVFIQTLKRRNGSGSAT